MENLNLDLDLLKSIIKRNGSSACKPTVDELHQIVINEYCRREAPTNKLKDYAKRMAWEMINNFYGIDTEEK